MDEREEFRVALAGHLAGRRKKTPESRVPLTEEADAGPPHRRERPPGHGDQGRTPRTGHRSLRPALDLTRRRTILAALDRYAPDIVVHAAAYTDLAGAENERANCWASHVGGTRNVVLALAGNGAKLVHISTDYVFWRDRGGYAEEDTPEPGRNYYALSKLAAEEVVRTRTDSLVIRTSFRPRERPYPVAFEDVYTGQDYVDVIAPEVTLAVWHAPSIPYSTLQSATERKCVYEPAHRRSPDVRPGKSSDARVSLSEDIGLDFGLWRRPKRRLPEDAPWKV